MSDQSCSGVEPIVALAKKLKGSGKYISHLVCFHLELMDDLKQHI